MSKNMSIRDRRLRALVVAPAAILIGVLTGPGAVGSVVLYAVGAVMLATSAAGYCPLYSIARAAGGSGRRAAGGSGRRAAGGSGRRAAR